MSSGCADYPDCFTCPFVDCIRLSRMHVTVKLPAGTPVKLERLAKECGCSREEIALALMDYGLRHVKKEYLRQEA